MAEETRSEPGGNLEDIPSGSSTPAESQIPPSRNVSNYPNFQDESTQTTCEEATLGPDTDKTKDTGFESAAILHDDDSKHLRAETSTKEVPGNVRQDSKGKRASSTAKGQTRQQTCDHKLDVKHQKPGAHDELYRARNEIADLKSLNSALEAEKVLSTAKIDKLRNQMDRTSEQYTRLKQAYENLKLRYDRESDDADAHYSRLYESYEKLQTTTADLRKELQEERCLVESLKKNIHEQEQIVTKAHSTAISLLARDVSSEFPDDMIKEQFVRFAKDLSEWCVDCRADKIADPDDARSFLEQRGLLRRDNNALEEPLRFDLKTTSMASAILLTAALSHELCEKMLKAPFFLASQMDSQPEPDPCTETPTKLQKSSPDLLLEVASRFPASEAVDWRVQTCKSLERAYPAKREHYEAMAKDFAKTYQLLLCCDLDKDDFHDLVDLFEAFGSLALRLLKLRTQIIIQGLGDPSGSLEQFQVMHKDMEAHPSVKLLPGDTRLDGRPVGVVVWPRILSEPVDNGGSHASKARTVLWSNAVVWVSNVEQRGRFTDYVPGLTSFTSLLRS